MAKPKFNVTTVGWSDVLKRTESDSGISKKTINESFMATDKTVKDIIKTGVPELKTEQDVLSINLPIAAVTVRYVDKYQAPQFNDSGEVTGYKHIGPSIGVAMLPPNEYVEIADEAFQLRLKDAKK